MSKLKKRYDVTTNEKFLKEKSRIVTELNSEVRTATELLLEHMKAYPEKQGVSAVQLGYLVRAHALRINNEVTVMYNLEFVHKFLFQFSNEGCSSLKDRYGLWRPLFGKIKYLDKDLKEQTMWLGKKQVRIAAHEIDHANGVLLNSKGRRWKFDTKTSGHYLPKA